MARALHGEVEMSQTPRSLNRRKVLTPAPSAPAVRRRRRPQLRRHPVLMRTLATLFAVEFVALAIAPRDRTTWLMENLLVALLVGAWIAAPRRIVLSRSTIVLVFAFLALHEIGAHYTYSEVPYESWLGSLGVSLERFDFERNHYDRLLHFLYGLCLTHPIRDVLQQVAHVRGFASYALPVAAVVGSSILYELLELGYAWIGGDSSANFLGAQGDARDGTKDMALASGGAVLAMALAAGVAWARAPAPHAQPL
jgi:putative membrane protein